MYYIGLDVHKKTISYCVKDASGQVHREGTIGATRNELDCWVRTLPQPRIMAMEATIFTGWIYDHLLPHAEQVKVAHPLMLRAIAAAKKKHDRIDFHGVSRAEGPSQLTWMSAIRKLTNRGFENRLLNMCANMCAQVKTTGGALLLSC